MAIGFIDRTRGELFMRSLLIVIAVLIVAPRASAEYADAPFSLVPAHVAHDPWQISWVSPDDTTAAAPTSHVDVIAARLREGGAQQPPVRRPVAIEYSDAYQTRRKIHKYASFATLPLFATEIALGQSLYNTPTNGLRGVHATIGIGIVGLFGLNTVTGAWNMFGEGWKDPNGRTLRLVHGLLMMVADAGFVATTMSGPNSQSRSGAANFDTRKVTHRNLAIASISVASVSYFMMLFGNR
jgi:hypothetical protein